MGARGSKDAAAAAAAAVPDVPHSEAEQDLEPLVLEEVWKLPGATPSEKLTILQMCMDHDGNVLVTSAGDDCISALSCIDGSCLRQWGIDSDRKRVIDKPCGVGVGVNGDLYVCDSNHNRIVVFGESGKVDRTFGWLGIGQVSQFVPSHVAVAATSNDDLYVADFFNNEIKVMSRTGKHLRKMHHQHIRAPIGIALDEESGHVYICSNWSRPFGAVVVCELQTGQHVRSIWRRGKQQLKSARAVALDKTRGVLAVADSFRGTVEVFRMGDGEHIRTINPVDGGAPIAVLFDARGRLLIACGVSNTIEVWKSLEPGVEDLVKPVGDGGGQVEYAAEEE